MFQNIHIQLHRSPQSGERRKVEVDHYPPSAEGGGFDRVQLSASVVLGDTCLLSSFELLVPFGRGEVLAEALRKAIEP